MPIKSAQVTNMIQLYKHLTEKEKIRNIEAEVIEPINQILFSKLGDEVTSEEGQLDEKHYTHFVRLVKLGAIYELPQDSTITASLRDREFETISDIFNFLYTIFIPNAVRRDIPYIDFIEKADFEMSKVQTYLNEYKRLAPNIKSPIEREFAALYASLRIIDRKYHALVCTQLCGKEKTHFPVELIPCLLDFSHLSEFSSYETWETGFEKFAEFIVKYHKTLDEHKISFKILDILYDVYQDNSAKDNNKYISFEMIYRTLEHSSFWRNAKHQISHSRNRQNIDQILKALTDLMCIFTQSFPKNIFINPYVDLFCKKTDTNNHTLKLFPTVESTFQTNNSKMFSAQLIKLSLLTNITASNAKARSDRELFSIGTGKGVDQSTGRILAERKIPQALSQGIPSSTRIELQFSRLYNLDINSHKWASELLKLFVLHYTPSKPCDLIALYIKPLKKRKTYENGAWIRVWNNERIQQISEKINIIAKLTHLIFFIKEHLATKHRIDPTYVLSAEDISQNSSKRTYQPIIKAFHALQASCQHLGEPDINMLIKLLREQGIDIYTASDIKEEHLTAALVI